jgi:hypothetical protein
MYIRPIFTRMKSESVTSSEKYTCRHIPEKLSIEKNSLIQAEISEFSAAKEEVDQYGIPI